MTHELDMLYQQIADLGRQFGARKVVLYGSRARGDNRPRSDIDIAVFGAPTETQFAFREALEQLPTLLAFDLLYVAENTNPALLANIKQDGVILMSKMQEKYDKLIQALDRLKESLDDYSTYQLDSIRDGVIQRFEFCAELSWKTLREYLIDQGYQKINSPKAVIKQAFEDDLVQDEAGWIQLLNARNLTAHTYDEGTAQEVLAGIQNTYYRLMKQLAEELSR